MLLVLGLLACGCATVSFGRRLACGTSAKLVPTCGVIWGVATNPNTNSRLTQVQTALGRPFDLVYRFHDLNDPVPTPEERALVRSGHFLHVTIDSRIYGQPDHGIPWADITGGRYDRALRAQARGIASLRVPVFLTFDHEPDQPGRSTLGSPAQFRAAWRHVHDLFRAAGATNAVWVWVVTGYRANFTAAGQLWPGNDYVDWISWEAYNGSGCLGAGVDATRYRSFAQSAIPFYDWVTQHGPALGIDITKPMMISEAGSVEYPGDAQLTARWYSEIPHVLANHPQIKAIALWDRPGTKGCPYQFDNSAPVRQAVAVAGSSSTIRGK